MWRRDRKLANTNNNHNNGEEYAFWGWRRKVEAMRRMHRTDFFFEWTIFIQVIYTIKTFEGIAKCWWIIYMKKWQESAYLKCSLENCIKIPSWFAGIRHYYSFFQYAAIGRTLFGKKITYFLIWRWVFHRKWLYFPQKTKFSHIKWSHSTNDVLFFSPENDPPPSKIIHFSHHRKWFMELLFDCGSLAKVSWDNEPFIASSVSSTSTTYT